VLDSTGAPLADPATTSSNTATAPTVAARTTQINLRKSILRDVTPATCLIA
jgi:hypothetical protein